MDPPNKSLAPRRCTESEPDPSTQQRDTDAPSPCYRETAWRKANARPTSHRRPWKHRQGNRLGACGVCALVHVPHDSQGLNNAPMRALLANEPSAGAGAVDQIC